MHCFRCHAENVEGAKFCGHCGAPLGGPMSGVEVAPHVTSPTTQLPATIEVARSDYPPLARDGRPSVDESLGGSLPAPRRSGARVAAIAIVLVLDAAMAIGGLLLLTRARDVAPAAELAGDAAAVAADAGATAVVDAGRDGGVVVEVVPDAASAGGGGGRGTGAVPAGGTRGGGGRGGGKGTGAGSGTGGGTTRDAGLSARPDARPAATDAGPAASSPPDAAPDDPSADELPDQVAIKLRQSQARLSRCYTQATKGLPEDEPLAGEVDIAFEVMPTGETRNVTVARNTTGSNTLGACIGEVVGTWSFVAFQGEPVNMQRTFRFRGAGH